MEKTAFGKTRDGQAVEAFTLRNANGLEMRCINYGCRIANLWVPGTGGRADVVMGFDDLQGYENGSNWQGSIVGRYAGRIRGAAFTLNGKRYTLPAAEGGNYLHGTFNQKVFSAEVIGENSVSFTYTSPDGEDGFPGELWTALTYTITDQNELVMDYRAVAKADTVVNLTNHAYFNLAGEQVGHLEGQTLQMNCSRMLEGDEETMPTGRMLETAGGVFDFLNEKPILQDIDADDPMLKAVGGYDHVFEVDRQQPEVLAHAATARHPQSGRAMRVYTTQPGMVFYTANHMQGEPGKGGRPMGRRCSFCLETQHFPDSPNQPNFPTTVLRAGEKYHQITVLQFEF